MKSLILVFDNKNDWWGATPEILGQTDPVGAKTPIFSKP